MKVSLISFFLGLLFAAGLVFAGMTQPQIVIGFLDLTDWNPALLFVMVGAIGIHAICYPFISRRATPLFASEFKIPDRRDITSSLVIGSLLFGVGWGLGGFCPAPALTALGTGSSASLVFVSAMLLGMWAYRRVEPWLPIKK